MLLDELSETRRSLFDVLLGGPAKLIVSALCHGALGPLRLHIRDGQKSVRDATRMRRKKLRHVLVQRLCVRINRVKRLCELGQKVFDRMLNEAGLDAFDRAVTGFDCEPRDPALVFHFLVNQLARVFDDERLLGWVGEGISQRHRAVLAARDSKESRRAVERFIKPAFRCQAVITHPARQRAPHSLDAMQYVGECVGQR